MSLPNPKILDAIIEEYLREREHDWQSTFGRVLSWVTNPLGNLIATRQATRTKLSNLFKCAKKLEDSPEQNTEIVDAWINICYELSMSAREAQNERALPILLYFLPEKLREWLNYTDSLFCQTLHAIRTLIIYQLATDSVLSEVFLSKRKNLRTALLLSDQTIRKKEISSIDVSKLKIEYKEDLLKLADLNEIDSILDAKKEGMLNKYILATQQDTVNFRSLEINTNIPLCYQEAFFLIFYTQSFQPKTQLDFRSFCRNASQAAISNAKQDIKLDDVIYEEGKENDDKELKGLDFDDYLPNKNDTSELDNQSNTNARINTALAQNMIDNNDSEQTDTASQTEDQETQEFVQISPEQSNQLSDDRKSPENSNVKKEEAKEQKSSSPAMNRLFNQSNQPSPPPPRRKHKQPQSPPSDGQSAVRQQP